MTANRKVPRDKMMKEKTLELQKTIDLIKQNIRKEKQTKNLLPEALFTTIEKQIIKEELMQKMKKN